MTKEQQTTEIVGYENSS